MFHLENTRGETVYRVVCQNWNIGVGDDRTGVVFGIDYVNSGAADPDSRCKYRLVYRRPEHPLPAELGKRSWVNINDLTIESR